jgi:hypothetical protein
LNRKTGGSTLDDQDAWPMAKSEWDLSSGQRRLRCPLCSGEMERDRCMCPWCGAVVYPAPREEGLRLEGVVCFSCGQGNPGPEVPRHCRVCGRPFATTCPGCTAPVPLRGRCCSGCGLSVEDFDSERTRQEVEARQERRDCERVLFAVFRWQVVVGLALTLLGFLLGRADPTLRRQLVGVGAGTGVFGALPLGLARLTGPRFRREG